MHTTKINFIFLSHGLAKSLPIWMNNKTSVDLSIESNGSEKFQLSKLISICHFARFINTNLFKYMKKYKNMLEKFLDSLIFCYFHLFITLALYSSIIII